MRRTTRMRWRGLGLLVLALLVGIGPVQAQAPSRDETIVLTPVPRSQPSEPAQLVGLARTGEFDRLLPVLKQQINVTDSAAANRLVQDIERFQFHRVQRSEARRATYEAALNEMTELAAAGKLDQAMTKALEAQNHAADSKAMLLRAQVVQLVEQVEAAAAEAAQQSDWLAALEFYANLNALYEPEQRYQSQVDQAERHLRLLRVYAPENLANLYEQRALRRGDDPPEPGQVGSETWQHRLRGVRIAMLYGAVIEAEKSHVDGSSFGSLAQGALEAAAMFAQARPLGQTFASLRNEARVRQFVDRVEAERQRLARRGRDVTRLEAMAAFDRVLAHNRQLLELPDAVLIYEMASGAMSQLDEFSDIIWPSQMDRFNRSMHGQFSGVGIHIGRENGRLTVVSPLEGTPAHQAGIRPNDIIAKVDENDTSTWSLDDAVEHITGPEGTPVVLTIERQGHEGPLEVKLVRQQIVIESIKGWSHRPGGGWDYYVDRENQIGYIRLTQFIPQTPDDLDAAINQMQQEQGLRALVLDLRFNTGGLLRKAVDVADRFVTEGPIVSTVGATGVATSRFRAEPRHTHPYVPMVVLVNGGSASASEIVAGALQDYQRALIIGERSFGKGSVQDLFRVDGNQALLKLTTQYYRLPGPDGRGGRIVHRRPRDKTWGIEPDMVVRMTGPEVEKAMEFRRDADVLRELGEPAEDFNVDDMLTRGLDPQLEAAVLYLKTQLVARELMVAMDDNR